MNSHSDSSHSGRPAAFAGYGKQSNVVDLADDHDLGFWTDRLSCSAEKLLAAVESVGPRVEHVTEYLRAGW